jgi:hypothetical protein
MAAMTSSFAGVKLNVAAVRISKVRRSWTVGLGDKTCV